MATVVGSFTTRSSRCESCGVTVYPRFDADGRRIGWCELDPRFVDHTPARCQERRR